jgi:hypothetical protein
MKRMLIKIIHLSMVSLLTILTSFFARASAEEPQRHEFVAVLIDTVSKKPVPSARVILAPKKKGIHQCTIDTSLTGVSNDRGEVRIPNVELGEYVFFYNLSGSLKPALKGKVVTYGGPHSPRYHSALAESLCPCIVTKQASLVIFDGSPSIAGGGFESRQEFDIRMITTDNGDLLTVRVPGARSAPANVEIITDLPKSSPPQPAPTAVAKASAGERENSATPAPLAEEACPGSWQSVDTTVPGSFALRLSTTKDGQQRLRWPNPTREVLVIAAHRAKGPADPQGMVQICSRGAVVTNGSDSVSLRDLETPLKLHAGYYLVNIRFQVGPGAPAKASNAVTIHIK